MTPPRLLAILLALAGATGVLFLLLRPEPAPDGAGVALPEGEAVVPVDRAQPQPGPVRGGDPLAGAAPEAAPARTALAEGSSAGARPLRVTLATPEGAPADPELAVVVVPAELLGGDEPGVLLERLRAEGDPAAGFARAPVGADGVAELPLPAGLREPRLLVDGRFLFLREAHAVDGDAAEVTLEPELGGAIEVRLVTPAGEDPRGELRLVGGSWGGGGGGWRTREQPVLGGGAHEFRGVDPELTWTLMPTLDEHHAELRMGVEVAAGRALRLELEVTPGATVRGEVVDGAGAPLAGVEVTAGGGMPWMGGAGARRAETAADGSFALRGVAPGVVEVEAEREGWLDATSGELELAEGEERGGVRLVLERGLSIAGLVRGTEGEPVQGADVTVERLTRQNWGGWGGSRIRREGRAATDAAGRFAISGLQEGSYTVRASLVDELSGAAARAALEGVEAGGPEVALDLAGPVAFEGRVVDDLEQPVPAFEIELASVEQGGPEERQAYEDPEGRFRFARAGPGLWRVRVEAEGHVQTEELEHALPDGGGELVLALLRTARVEGVVVGPTGAPVAGASVRGGDGSSENGGGGWGSWGRPRGPRTESGADGRFVLEDVAPGPLTLHAQAEGWADSPTASLELAPGEARGELVLALREGGRIEGQVLTPEGDPLAGRRVTYGSNAMGFGSRGDTTSDAAGRFAFDHVTPGEWAVSAVPSFEEFSDGMRGGGQSSFVEVMGKLITETVTVADGERVEVFLGGEPRQPVRIHGTVTRAGEPLPGAQVYAVSESSAVFEGMKTARADAGGAYELVLDRPGPHTISANSGDVGVERVVDVPRQDELRVDLAIPLGRIEGRVLEPDGSPAAGVRLSLSREDGLGRVRWAGGQRTAGEDGRYAFEDLEAGTYTVRANVAGWGGSANDRFGAAVQSGIAVGEDLTTRGVDFELQAAGAVEGLVVGADGAPVRGASLYFRDTQGRLVTSFSTVLSDAAGRFEKTGLAPGDYTVSARTESQAAGDEAAVRVTAGETAEVRVVVATAAVLLVTLEDEGGQARRARVEVLDADGRDVASLVTMEALRALINEGRSSEEQRVGPIPPGRYTVRATLADGRSASRRVRVRDRNPEQRVVLKLED